VRDIQPLLRRGPVPAQLFIDLADRLGAGAINRPLGLLGMFAHPAPKWAMPDLKLAITATMAKRQAISGTMRSTSTRVRSM
jgi:hypothetical protein